MLALHTLNTESTFKTIRVIGTKYDGSPRDELLSLAKAGAFPFHRSG